MYYIFIGFACVKRNYRISFSNVLCMYSDVCVMVVFLDAMFDACC